MGLMLIVMIAAIVLMSFFSRRQQQRAAEQQATRVEEAMVPGTWVRTRAGFYGTVVEVDGDVVTLATPLGEESLWNKAAIYGAEEPPFASGKAEAADGGAEPSVDGAAPIDAESAAAADGIASEEAPEG